MACFLLHSSVEFSSAARTSCYWRGRVKGGGVIVTCILIYIEYSSNRMYPQCYAQLTPQLPAIDSNAHLHILQRGGSGALPIQLFAAAAFEITTTTRYSAEFIVHITVLLLYIDKPMPFRSF